MIFLLSEFFISIVRSDIFLFFFFRSKNAPIKTARSAVPLFAVDPQPPSSFSESSTLTLSS